MGAQMCVRGAVLSDPAKSAPLHTESAIANCRSPSSRWSGYEMRDNKYAGNGWEVDERATRYQPTPSARLSARLYYLNGDLTVRCFVPGPSG